LRKLSSDRG